MEEIEYMASLTDRDRDKLDAAVMRRLIAHLDTNKDVQNIDLMILAGFCRNCLSKWYLAAADEHGVNISGEEAREHIYGMPYEQWKTQYQKPATPEQLAAMESRKKD
jgi:uncharacterized protein